MCARPSHEFRKPVFARDCKLSRIRERNSPKFGFRKQLFYEPIGLARERFPCGSFSGRHSPTEIRPAQVIALPKAPGSAQTTNVQQRTPITSLLPRGILLPPLLRYLTQARE